MKKSNFKSIEKYLAARKKERHRYYAQTQNSANNHQKWSEHEIELVVSHIMPDSELSKKIGRSVQAIQIMRWRIKRNGNQEKQTS